MYSICQQIWKTQQRSQDWKRSVFILIPKKSNAKECPNCHTIALISQTSKVMCKILQARLQQYVKQEFPDVQTGCRKSRRTRDQITNICWIIEKQESSRKTSTAALLTMPKALTVQITTNWKILQEVGIPDNLTYLLRNLCVGQEGTARTRHGTMNWFQIGKGVHQGCIFSPCLFNLYGEYIIQNVKLDKAQLESRLPGEIPITSNMQRVPPLWQKVKRN